jgi:hypothetical protein
MTKAVILLIVILILAGSANAVQIIPGEGVTFHQVNLTFPGASQPYSRYGMIIVEYNVLASVVGYPTGYVNVRTNQGWVVRNMPVDTTSCQDGSSMMFDLGGPGMITSLLAYVDYSSSPVTSFSATPNTIFGITYLDYNAQGVDVPFSVPPNDTTEHDSLVFFPGGATWFTWLAGAPNVEQDEKQCAPGAVANSLQWLDDNYLVPVPDPHVPGIRDGSLVGQLDLHMSRPPHRTVSYANLLDGKLDYIGCTGLRPFIRCRHKNRVGSAFLPNANRIVTGVTSWVNANAGLPLIDWVIRQIRAHEDVELVIAWDGGGAHCVRVYGGGYILGVPCICYLHDAKQGWTDPHHTPADSTDDETAINGGITRATGGLGTAFVVNDRFIGNIGKGKVTCAISESPRLCYINKRVHVGGGGGPLGLKVVFAGHEEIYGHYDGHPDDWRFTEFESWFDGENTTIFWTGPVDPTGTPRPLPYCTWVHIGWEIENPFDVVEMAWTDGAGITQPDWTIKQPGSDAGKKDAEDPPRFRLTNGMETGTAEISDVYYRVFDDPLALADLSLLNPALDPDSMTLLTAGPFSIEAGGETLLTVPEDIQEEQAFVYRFNGGGINEFIDFGQQEIMYGYLAGATEPKQPLKGSLLGEAYPNPFSARATIAYTMTRPGRATLKVYDLEGRAVRTLVDAWKHPSEGGHTAVWDGTNDLGRPVASGVYFVRISTRERTEARPIVLLR